MSATDDIRESDDGWVVYDEFVGPQLDAERWTIGVPPSDPESAPQHDENAEVAVSDGEVCVRVPTFSRTHDGFQAADNVKFLMMSSPFALPERGPVSFAVDLAAKNLGDDGSDVRDGMVAFNLVDVASGLVFDLCATSKRAFALHEGLEFARGPEGAFTYVIESPFTDLRDDMSTFRHYEITIDRGASTVAWFVDGHEVYKISGAEIPAQLHMGFGIFTLRPIRDGKSQSNHGQGIEGRWKRFSYRGVKAANA